MKKLAASSALAAVSIEVISASDGSPNPASSRRVGRADRAER
jgi:hypothetical protein